MVEAILLREYRLTLGANKQWAMFSHYFDASPPVSFRVATGAGFVSSLTVVAVL